MGNAAEYQYSHIDIDFFGAFHGAGKPIKSSVSDDDGIAGFEFH